MKSRNKDGSSVRVRSLVLVAMVLGAAGLLGAWKLAAVQQAEAAAANQPEPMEVVTGARAVEREHSGTATAIGTVLATRSVTLRNELPGTVRGVRLAPGQVVEPGAVLVALDVSVEEAELKALQAQAELAEATLARVQRLAERRAVSAIELDNARAERDIALAQIARTRAIIARKTIRAPFRARVGLADIHPGQFLEAGTLLTTLQGVDATVHVDFAVAQAVASGLRAGDVVEVLTDGDGVAARARIVALDARVDPATRNTWVRARLENAGDAPAPGASVRVRVPTSTALTAVAVPVNALRRSPGGDHVFVLQPDEAGDLRAHLRPVRAGPVLGEDVLVLEGLSAGEQVAAAGSFKLREAVRVHVEGEELAGAATPR